VKCDADQVDVARRVAVEPVVPARAAEAGAVVDVAVEDGLDVVAGGKVHAGELVRQRLRVPGVRQRRAGEVGVCRQRPGLTEPAVGRVAGERIEVCRDLDLDRAVEQAAPEIGGVLECDQPLSSPRGAAVAADGGNRCRIVEAFPRIVRVDDGNGGGLCPCEAGRELHDGQDEQRQDE